MISSLVALSLFAATPKVGDLAPDFDVKDVDGHAQKLSSLVEQHTVILAFFPKAFTGG